MPPRVSIGLPVYNGSNYLRESIDSLLAQSFVDFELIIGDNASDDATESICREYAHLDSRVVYHRHATNLGAARNYNFVFERSRGHYFRWQAHDDLCEPELLAGSVELLDSAGDDAAIAYSLWGIIDGAGDPVADEGENLRWRGDTPAHRVQDLIEDRSHSLLERCSPVFGLMRRKLLERTGLIRPYQSSDEVLLVELALHGDFRLIPERLFYRRYHPDMSLRANLSPEERMAWFDPAQPRRRFPMPRTRLAWGHFGVILRAPIPLIEKLACLRVLARWLSRDEWRVIGGEFKIRLRQALASTTGRASESG